MLPPIFLWLPLFLPFISALPTTPSLASLDPLNKRCTNALQNPSFETGDAPWLTMALGSWQTRGLYTSAEGGHTGRNFFYAHTNATASEASLNLSQYDIQIPSGQEIDCGAWVASWRPGNAGSTRVDVFLDGMSCGSTVWLGTSGWVRVGGKVRVGDGPHTMSVVVISYEAGEEGASIWIDDAVVGVGC